MGFMGKMHLRCWNALENARVVAVCDIEPSRLAGAGGTSGNIAGAEEQIDLSEVECFSDGAEMLASVNLDAVSITLPTELHARYTRIALQTGVNVLCEKPMALTLEECASMIAAAKDSGKLLQVGHCIRFWPEYACAKQIIDSRTYGKVLSASFQRLSSTPGWSWKGWLLDGARSGGAILDMHIHDSDFVHYLFGLPQSVFCRGVKHVTGAYDHVLTSYHYPDGKLVSAEGGWIMAPGFGFRMSFQIVLEGATLTYDSTRSPSLQVCPVHAESYTPQIAPGDGYSQEISHFAHRLNGAPAPSILTPHQSAASVRLVLAERQSADTGQPVFL